MKKKILYIVLAILYILFSDLASSDAIYRSEDLYIKMLENKI